jgi:hypothetical protein
MRIVISYEIDVRNNERVGAKNIDFDFEQVSDSTLVDEIKCIQTNEDYTDSEKVQKFKEILCGFDDLQDHYEFNDQICEISYRDTPPKKLYLEFGFSSNDDSAILLPIKVHTIPTISTYGYQVREYTFMTCNGWDSTDRYEWTG